MSTNTCTMSKMRRTMSRLEAGAAIEYLIACLDAEDEFTFDLEPDMDNESSQDEEPDTDHEPGDDDERDVDNEESEHEGRRVAWFQVSVAG